MKTSSKSITNLQNWRLAAIALGSALALTLANTTFAMGSGNPPSINSGNATGTVNVAFSYQITANNSPTSYGAILPLPPGLGIHTTTGVIDGTPTAAGVYTVHLSATNAFGTGKKMSRLRLIRGQLR
jgi:putative Ig domain-containing protein